MCMPDVYRNLLPLDWKSEQNETILELSNCTAKSLCLNARTLHIEDETIDAGCVYWKLKMNRFRFAIKKS